MIDKDEQIGNAIGRAFYALARAREHRETGRKDRAAWWLTRAAWHREWAYHLMYGAR